MYRNPSKKPMYPSHNCSNKNCTDTDLVKKRRSSDLDYIGSRSDNKLLRNCNRSKTRCPKDQEMLGSCSRQKFNDIVLVNITDRHTANANCCGHTKIKKMGKSCKKSQKSSNGSITNSKPVIRTKPGVKENSPNYAGKGKKGAVVKCSCKTLPNSLIGQENVKETIKLSGTDDEDPIKNALQLTNQIKTNIDSIRAQSNKRCSIQGLPQCKFVITGKPTPDIKPNISSVTAPYIQKLRDEINANRNHSTQRQPPSSISHADQEIINLRNEILQYKLKSEQDLPQAMVIEVSYLNDGEATDKKVILSKKCSRDENCSKHTECQKNCNFTITDYSAITEKPVIDETQSIRNKLDEIEDQSSVQQSRESFDSAVNSITNPVSQLKGIVRVSIKDKSDLTKSRKKKGGTPATEDGDSTGHAFDELDPDTVDTIDEEGNICYKENKSPWNSKEKVSISSLDSHENEILNKRLSNKEADLPSENDSLVNESFLRDQIAGMKKIDKLVEEAEQSISKVVKGFDKFFMDPNIKSRASMDLIDIKRKDLKFDIDDSCDCPQTLRCDCESKDLDQESSLGIQFSPAPSEPLTTEPISDTDHLNTISEQSESIVASPSNSGCNIKSVLSDIVSQNDESLRDEDIKMNAKISMDTRNTVQIPPLTNPIEEAPLLREAGTETDDMKNRLKSNGLEIQNMPGIEIRSSFVVQKIYNINIQPSSNLTDPVHVPNKKNAFFIELKHDDPVIVQMVGSQRAPYFDNKDKEPMEISVVKAPVSTVQTRESITQTPNRKMGKNCKYCMHKVDSTPENKEEIVDELFDDIRDFQIPMVSTRSVDANSNTSSVSEYVVVQDDATQVSASNISRDDRVQASTSKSCNIQTCGSAPKEPEQIETFVSTGTASSTNMRPPIRDLPMDTYQPIPYDEEEIVEIELFNKPLEGSDVTPFDLLKGTDSRLTDVEKAQCTPKSLDSSRCGSRKSMEEMKPTDKDDTITLQPAEKKNADNNFMLAPVDSCDLMNGCPIRTVVRVEKPDNFSDLNDFICLANAYDFNAACEDNISSAGINTTGSRQTAPADQMAMNKNANEQKLIDLIGFKVNCRQRLDESDQNDKSCMRCDTPRIRAKNDEEQKRIDLIGSKVNARQQPNEFDEIDKSSNRSSIQSSTDETEESKKRNDSNASSISRSERPISSAIRDTIQEISTVDLSAIDTANLTPTVDIEGVQIMETTYESSRLQNLYHAPYPDRAPPAGPTNPNPTAMSAMVQYDQQGVNESLGQNLLLAQLRDDATLVSYHKRPSAYIDSSSSEISSHSSGDYPERNKYLMRAKRRQLSYQRGIITDDPDDFILSRCPERYDPLSDGELSHYTTSTGEMLPIGPRLLKNKNFMRRRPDRIFQMELNQRNIHIHRQHNYFNNWVSYYVTDNANL